MQKNKNKNSNVYKFIKLFDIIICHFFGFGLFCLYSFYFHYFMFKILL